MVKHVQNVSAGFDKLVIASADLYRDIHPMILGSLAGIAFFNQRQHVIKRRLN